MLHAVDWWMAGRSESIIISGIAVGTLLLASCLITAFCLTRSVLQSTVLVHGQVTIIFVVSVGLSVGLFV